MPQMHEIGAHEPGEGDRAGDGTLGGLRQAEQQKGEQRHRDLDANGVLGSSEEAGDLQRLLDPAEEEFDCPATPVEARVDLRAFVCRRS